MTETNEIRIVSQAIDNATPEKAIGTKMKDQSKSIEEYVEKLGMFFEGLGLPRMAGRIFAWLLICEPPDQTAAQIEKALDASSGSISTNLRMLTHFDMVEKIGVPGDRAAHYIVRPGSLLRAIDRKIRAIEDLKSLLSRGIELLEDRPPESKERLREVLDIYDFFQQEMKNMVRKYRKQEKSG